MKKAVCTILFLLTAWSVFSEEQKELISVFDFSANGISEKETMLLVDFMTSNIVESGKYEVIDRMQRETILSEIEFSLTGCTDESCQLEAGKLLQANKIVVGSLGNFGDNTLVNLKLIEVETGKTLSSVSEKYSNFNEVINDNNRLVNMLLGIKRKIISEDGNDEESNEATSLEIYSETELLIKQNLTRNSPLISSRAYHLSPEERNALYMNNKKNAASGALLNILPGFGVGSFVNNDPAAGFAQLTLDLISFAGIAVWRINDGLAGINWQDDHIQDFVQGGNETSTYEGVAGDYIIDGELVLVPETGWSETLGIVGAAVYVASKIIGVIIPLITTEPYNEQLEDTLNISE